MTWETLPTFVTLQTAGVSAGLQALSDAIAQMRGDGGSGLDFAKLNQAAAQSLADGAWTSITFTSEDADEISGHSVTTNTSRYNVGVDGQLQIEAGVAFAANATGVRGIRFARNGAAIGPGRVVVGAAPSGSTEIAMTRTITVSAGDYVEVQAYQSSGGALNTAYTAGEVGCYMNVRLIRP